MRRVIFLLSAVLLAGFAPLASAEIKIAVVDIQALAQNSPQAREATDRLRTEFTARKKEIDALAAKLQQMQEKLNKDGATMTEMQRSGAEKDLRDGSRDLSAKKAAFDDDLNARQQEEQAKITRLLDEEVSAFAKAQGYDLILADGVIFASGALNVTAAILQSMQSKAPAAAAPAAGSKPATPAKP